MGKEVAKLRDVGSAGRWRGERSELNLKLIGIRDFHETQNIYNIEVYFKTIKSILYKDSVKAIQKYCQKIYLLNPKK